MESYNSNTNNSIASANSNSNKSGSKNLTFMYTAHQSLYWIVVCCIVSFAATYLTEKGLAVSTVGIVLFSANMVSFLLQLFLAGIADRAGDSRAIKMLMIILSAVPLLIMLILYLAELPLWLMAVLYVPMVAGFDMELPLMNSVVVFYSKRNYDISFGIGRAMGAAMFGAASLGMGYAMRGLGSDIMLVFAIVFTFAYIAVAFLYPKEQALLYRTGAVAGARTGTGTDTTPGYGDTAGSDVSGEGGFSQQNSLPLVQFLAKYKWYTLSLFGVLCFGAVHLASENYLIEIVRPLGGDSSNVGIALMIGTFLEMPVTLIAARVYKKLQAHKIWMLIGLSYTVRMLIYVLAGNIGIIYLAQVLQISSYSLMPPSQLLYANDCVDDRDMVKGQSTSTALYSLGNALGNLFGGLAVSAVGVTAMLAGCVGGAFAGFLLVAIFVPFAIKAASHNTTPQATEAIDN